MKARVCFVAENELLQIVNVHDAPAVFLNFAVDTEAWVKARYPHLAS